MRTPLSRVTGRSAEGAAAEAVAVWLPEAPRDRVLPSLHRHSRCAGSLVTPPVESRHQEEAASQMRGGGTRPSQAHPLLAPWGFVALPMPAWGRSGLTMAGQLRWGAHGRRARVVTGGHPGHRLCLLRPLRRGHGWSWRRLSRTCESCSAFAAQGPSC